MTPYMQSGRLQTGAGPHESPAASGCAPASDGHAGKVHWHRPSTSAHKLSVSVVPSEQSLATSDMASFAHDAGVHTTGPPSAVLASSPAEAPSGAAASLPEEPNGDPG
jgi:hypothetical protein